MNSIPYKFINKSKKKSKKLKNSEKVHSKSGLDLVSIPYEIYSQSKEEPLKLDIKSPFTCAESKIKFQNFAINDIRG